MAGPALAACRVAALFLGVTSPAVEVWLRLCGAEWLSWLSWRGVAWSVVGRIDDPVFLCSPSCTVAERSFFELIGLAFGQLIHISLTLTEHGKMAFDWLYLCTCELVLCYCVIALLPCQLIPRQRRLKSAGEAYRRAAYPSGGVSLRLIPVLNSQPFIGGGKS